MNTYRHALLIAVASMSVGVAGDAFAAIGAGSSYATPEENKANPAKVTLETDYQKAEYLIKGEQYDEAIVLLQRVVNQFPGDTDAWNLLGFATRKLGRNQEALGYYQEALALDANHKGEGTGGITGLVDSDPGGIALFYDSKNYGAFDWSRVQDPEIDRLLAEQASALDPEKRNELLSELQVRIMDQALIYPLYQGAFLYGVSNAVQGFHTNLLAYPYYADVSLAGS